MDADYLSELPTRARLDGDLTAAMSKAKSYEDALDATRRFAREQMFRVGVQVIEGLADASAAGAAFTHIAEAIVAALLPAAEAELAASAGVIPGGAFVIVAMGKLGGREMTAGSDLDLIFVYDAPDDVEASDGAKPLSVPLYYARLAQRYIAALTVLTAAGGLYDVDMRLRPTGNKGPVAVSFESFARYHAQESWTWERMALTRARVVSAPPGFRENVETVIRSTLTGAGDATKIVSDAREMREKLAAQYPGKNRWDLKFAPGGLVDIEFMAQVLQLVNAHEMPEVLDTNTIDALRKLEAAGAVSPAHARSLIDAAQLEHALTQVLRIALDGTLDPAQATPGLKALLSRTGGFSDFDALEARLALLQDDVRAIFDALIR